MSNGLNNAYEEETSAEKKKSKPRSKSVPCQGLNCRLRQIKRLHVADHRRKELRAYPQMTQIFADFLSFICVNLRNLRMGDLTAKSPWR